MPQVREPVHTNKFGIEHLPEACAMILEVRKSGLCSWREGAQFASQERLEQLKAEVAYVVAYDAANAHLRVFRDLVDRCIKAAEAVDAAEASCNDALEEMAKQALDDLDTTFYRFDDYFVQVAHRCPAVPSPPDHDWISVEHWEAMGKAAGMGIIYRTSYDWFKGSAPFKPGEFYGVISPRAYEGSLHNPRAYRLSRLILRTTPAHDCWMDDGQLKNANFEYRIASASDIQRVESLSFEYGFEHEDQPHGVPGNKYPGWVRIQTELDFSAAA